MSVTLRQVKNKDGSTSLYLDIYSDGKRYKEFLKQLKLSKPSTAADKESNKTRLALAKKIAVQRAAELQANDYNVTAEHRNKVGVLEYFDSYISRYTKNDKRNVIGVTNALREFLKQRGFENIQMKGLTEAHVVEFAEYLQGKSKGEGASSYFARFKKVLKHASREKLLLVNPATEVTIKREEHIAKNILTLDEIQLLAGTETLNEELKTAFLFSCFTGLRWVDVKALQWKHIDLKSQILAMVQAKTGIRLTLQLHDTAIQLLPKRGKPEEFVFDLPSHTGASKTLLAWVKRAGIEKHITWHCARHSFATNLIALKADVTIVSKLLGHNSLKYTQRYTHIAEDLKRAAIDSLPSLEFGKKTK